MTKGKQRMYAAFKNVCKSVPSSWSGMSKSTSSVSWHSDQRNQSFSAICRSKMSVAVNAGWPERYFHHLNQALKFNVNTIMYNV